MTSDLSSEKIEVVLEPTEGPGSRDPVRLDGMGVIVVGRSGSAHYRLPKDDKRHSRLHFVVEFNPPICRVLDLGSRNGTLVNGHKIFSAELYDGDVIVAGASTFRVRLGGGSFHPFDSEDNHLGAPAASALADDDAADSMAFDSLQKKNDNKHASAKNKEPKTKEKKIKKVVAPILESGDDARRVRKKNAAEQLKRLTRQPQSPEFDIDQLLAGESSAGSAADFQQLAAGDAIAIPGYELLRSLGRGSIGEVFLARSDEDGQQVAVKIMRSSKVSNTVAVEAFLAEMNPLLELEHPNLVKYRAFGATTGCLYAVSDYIEGIDAERLLKNDGAMGVVRVAKLGGQLLLGLDYAHGLGHVHRDIKPSNILITEGNNREVCLLSDFGLARTFQNSPLFGVKMKRDLECSVRFMAPEQFMNFKEMPMAVDIYSMGATLYNLLTTKFIHDFESLSFDQSVNKLKRDDAVPLIRRRFDIPAEMAILLHQALSRFPQKRVATAAVFRKELYKFIK